MYPSREELSQLHKSIQFSLLFHPHYIPSSPSCDHVVEACECDLEFSCPLCIVSGSNLTLIEDHYHQTHLACKEELDGNSTKYTVLPCGLSHFTARQSSVSCKTTTNLYHYHCPCCTLLLSSGSELQLHFRASHNTSSRHEIEEPRGMYGETYIFNEEVSGSGFCSKVKYNPKITLREFPVALSIVEQSGGRSETKKTSRSHESYCFLHELSPVTCCEMEITGCNRQPFKLFKDCCFLICGVDLPQVTISAIHSLGGTLTGSNYLESSEWNKVTHILLANRISLKSVRTLKRTVAQAGREGSIHWVSTEWVRERVEKGSLLGLQNAFSPHLIEKYFQAKETASRIEKRRSMRCKPEIPSIIPFQVNRNLLFPSSDSSCRRPSPPVLETSSNDSLVFKATPEASPVITAAPIQYIQTENVTSYRESPIVQFVSTIPSPPLTAGRKRLTAFPQKNVTDVLHVDTLSPVRRSKRLSVMCGPTKFSLVSHTQHSIKKE